MLLLLFLPSTRFVLLYFFVFVCYFCYINVNCHVFCCLCPTSQTQKAGRTRVCGGVWFGRTRVCGGVCFGGTHWIRGQDYPTPLLNMEAYLHSIFYWRVIILPKTKWLKKYDVHVNITVGHYYDRFMFLFFVLFLFFPLQTYHHVSVMYCLPVAIKKSCKRCKNLWITCFRTVCLIIKSPPAELWHLSNGVGRDGGLTLLTVNIQLQYKQLLW